MAAMTPKEGLLYGTLTGLVGGTVVTGFMDFAPKEPVAAAPMSSGVEGLFPQVEMWVPSVQVAPAAQDQPERYLVMVQGTFK